MMMFSKGSCCVLLTLIAITVISAQPPNPLSTDTAEPASSFAEPFPLTGERDVIKRNDRIIHYVDPDGQKILGTLILTNYRLRVTRIPGPLVVDIPLGAIDRIAKTRSKIVVYCKDVTVRKFDFSGTIGTDGEVLYKGLQKYSFPLSYKGHLFAFDHFETPTDNIWDYDSNIGLTMKEMLQKNPKENWVITNINEDYALCATYPKVLAVPKGPNENELKEAAEYRTEHRLPVLSWIHPRTQATITRSSQPKPGLFRGILRLDNSFVRKYLDVIINTNDDNRQLFIFDARPSLNAWANILKGGGTETIPNSKIDKLVFGDIENIRVVRESAKDLEEFYRLQSGDNQEELKEYIKSSKWIANLKQILKGATQIASKVQDEQTSVLVHCSDGWDRTSQLTSLAMLMLDSKYRTIKGFQILIDKEWLSFGHKFQQRLGHGSQAYTDSQRSPIFLQFIHCVWHILQQNRNYFQFNEHFLTTIIEHSYSCRFGTFLYNNERERFDNKIQQQTRSLWSYMNSQIRDYENVNYVSDQNGVKLALDLEEGSWSLPYCRWNVFRKPSVPTSVTTHNKAMRQLHQHLISGGIKLKKTNHQMP